jgi:Putative prokaryotic signal transducing protein
MKLVLKTNNPVQLNFAEALLKDAGIQSFRLDEQASSTDGSLGILPRRLMVADEDFGQAEAILKDGLADEAPWSTTS